jgi:hypothetical protein
MAYKLIFQFLIVKDDMVSMPLNLNDILFSFAMTFDINMCGEVSICLPI